MAELRPGQGRGGGGSYNVGTKEDREQSRENRKGKTGALGAVPRLAVRKPARG